MNFRSCFITDVSINKDKILLTDSSRNKYIVDITNDSLKEQFGIWFKTIFKKGVAQTLTIFEYELVDVSECEQQICIKQFIFT